MNIPAGIYRARANGAELDRNKDGTHDVVNVGLVIDGPDGPVNATTYLHFSEKAAKFSLDRLRALGWPGGTTFEKLPNAVDVTVKYETYEGKEQMKVDILTGGGGIKAKNPPSEAERKHFFAGLNKALGAPADPRTANAKPAGGGGGGGGKFSPDDEIPFIFDAICGDAQRP